MYIDFKNIKIVPYYWCLEMTFNYIRWDVMLEPGDKTLPSFVQPNFDRNDFYIQTNNSANVGNYNIKLLAALPDYNSYVTVNFVLQVKYLPPAA